MTNCGVSHSETKLFNAHRMFARTSHEQKRMMTGYIKWTFYKCLGPSWKLHKHLVHVCKCSPSCKHKQTS